MPCIWEFISSQVRVVNDVPPTGDYTFAKYNKVLYTAFMIVCYSLIELLILSSLSFCFFPTSFYNPHSIVCIFAWMQSVDILKYTDEEYENHLTDPVSVCLKEEFLFLLCIKLRHVLHSFCTCLFWIVSTLLIVLQLAGVDQGRDRSVVWILSKFWSPVCCNSWSISGITDCGGIEGSLLQWYVGPYLFSDHYPFTYTLSFHLFSFLISLFLFRVAPGFVKKYKDWEFSYVFSFVVTRALLRARAQSPADVANHPLMKVNFLLYLFIANYELLCHRFLVYCGNLSLSCYQERTFL